MISVIDILLISLFTLTGTIAIIVANRSSITISYIATAVGIITLSANGITLVHLWEKSLVSNVVSAVEPLPRPQLEVLPVHPKTPASWQCCLQRTD
jgi:hypothetical protein